MSYYSFHQPHHPNKCAVIGCTGVGIAAAHLLSRSDFIDALVLIDPDQRVSESVAADLCCSLPLNSHTDIWAGDYSDLSDCKLIIFALGHVRLYENAHADLLELNLPLIRKAATGLMAHEPTAIILNLCLPCEITTHALMQYTGLPYYKIAGIGTLPHTLYFRRLLGKYLGVNAWQIHASVIGESERGVLCADTISVNGILIDDYLAAIGRGSDKAIIESLYEDTVTTFQRAENATGCVLYANSHACALVARSIFTDANAIFPLCASAHGIADLPQTGLSLPCRIGQHGIVPLPETLMPFGEIDELRRTAARLHAQIMDAEQILDKKRT